MAREQGDDPDYWPEVTNPNAYRYYFYRRHHGDCRPTISCWKPDVSRQEEFKIFEIAVSLDLADEDGNLYNLRKVDGKFLELGTVHQQIALFWKPPNPSDAWHGFPYWPINAWESSNRGKQKNRPSKLVLSRLIDQGVISAAQSRRLNNGKTI